MTLKEHWNQLNLFFKVTIIIAVIIPLIFAPIYYLTISRVGFSYKDAILVPSQEGDVTIYSGKLEGKKAVFTVSADDTVTLECGGTVYGPYTLKEDESAIPEDNDLAEYMTGIEIDDGEDIMFRGGVYEANEDFVVMCGEDGTDPSLLTYVEYDDGRKIKPDGTEYDPAEPTVNEIYDLIKKPELTHNGSWMVWLMGGVICLINIFMTLYADELFRWNLRFRISNAEDAEPSALEIFSRYIASGFLVFMAVAVLVMGLDVFPTY